MVRPKWSNPILDALFPTSNCIWQIKYLHFLTIKDKIYKWLNGGFVMRTQIILKCTECKEENYSTTRNKKLHPDRMDVKKYCPKCQKQTVHREKK